MLTKRIIPCLDVKGGRTVKGINFINLRDAGDPVELAAAYAQQGADELVFLDISASEEERKTMHKWVRDVARQINIPYTVGGGINSVADVAALLEAGADKVSINTAAVERPALIEELANAFGSQCIVVAIDARKIHNTWTVHTHGGKRTTDKKLFTWAKEVQERGAGEILFTSMDHDGTQQGFAIDALQKLNMLLHIPVIASGGAGSPGHFLDVFVLGRADAALAASVFHFGTIKIPELKHFLHQKNIPVRL
ncbi:MAG: imidazole glycerol phosphate synthase subunit HisF [Cyclobacteriaceae bacterium]|nr:imidazole glycerol phosphate synthase subunit HisF [Cyclobacteriaceae bacterium]MCX7637628.1 imidazole glycerol phosphate synthase subunit HisF [Cyclobacteriaceae bacterium]MDW8331688.1 imidazole glycerol phosphate synthase subunit HisF [Cyclobacteriaceae bacterium]